MRLRPLPSHFVRIGPLIAVALLSACSSTPTRRGGGPGTAPDTASAGPSKPSASTGSPARRGGGYYLDDGPGDNPPPDLDLLPDAVPRVEKYASGANRPYNVFGVDYVPDLSGAPYKRRGVGSWYGRKFHGQRTSNGEIYDMYGMTAAHPTLPIPSYALVTNVQNGRSVIVRVNDRGPFLHNRVMDLSYAAAHKLGYMSSGSGMIEVEMLLPRDIAAGRIPATTNGLLASASMAGGRPAAATLAAVAATSGPPVARDAAVNAAINAGIVAPTAAGAAAPEVAGLSIEALTASMAPPGLPPAPTLAADASARSLPRSLQPSLPRNDVDGAPDLVALPDRQPAALLPITSLPATATRTGFYLQLGAFRAKAGADSFASHVAREIDPALASRVTVSDANGLFRVRVGPYALRAEADSAAAGLRAAIAQPVLVMPDAAVR